MKTLRIKYENLEHAGFDGGGTEILHYQGKPFTGICLTYEDAGWLSLEKEFQDGYQEGWVRLYYENGQLEEEYFMHNNIMNPDLGGAWDEEGNPR